MVTGPLPCDGDESTPGIQTGAQAQEQLTFSAGEADLELHFGVTSGE